MAAAPLCESSKKGRAAVAKLLLNLSRALLLFLSTLLRFQLHTHIHTYIVLYTPRDTHWRWVSVTFSGSYLGARSLCTLKPSTNNTHPAAAVYNMYCVCASCVLVLLFFIFLCDTMDATLSNAFSGRNFCKTIWLICTAWVFGCEILKLEKV